MGWRRNLILGACVVCTAIGALGVRDAAGFKKVPRGNGGGNGGGQERWVTYIRAHVDAGMHALGHGRSGARCSNVKHLRLPGATLKRFVDAATAVPECQLRRQPAGNLAELFHGLLLEGINGARRASEAVLDIASVPVIGGSDRDLTMFLGGSVSGMPLGSSPGWDQFQEGFVLLFAAGQERLAWARDGGAYAPGVVGSRIWAARPGGFEVPFGQDPHPAIGVDFVSSGHWTDRVRALSDGPEASSPDRTRPDTHGGELIIIPWVADAIPAFDQEAP